MRLVHCGSTHCCTYIYTEFILYILCSPEQLLTDIREHTGSFSARFIDKVGAVCVCVFCCRVRVLSLQRANCRV